MAFKLIVMDELENLLLDRKQINFKIFHQKMATPTRGEVQSKLAAQFNVEKERVIIQKLTPKYGQEMTVGYAKIYDSKEKAEEIEPKYVLKRNQPKEETKSE